MPDTTADEGFAKLDLSKIVATAERLDAQIGEEFSGRGLHRVAGQLVRLVEGAEADVREIARPRWRLRIAVGVLGLVILGTFVFGAVLVFQDTGSVADLRSFDWLAIAESAVNDAVFGGIALFFLLSIERRSKRGQALAALHRLRSFAHVIDMHQLTKDPERMPGTAAGITPESSAVDMSPEELGRYLDLCSELLSIIGKVAAVYAEASLDTQVLATVNEIETLTVGLSRKIWQKITILHVNSGGSAG